MIQTPTEVVRQFLASTTNPTIVKSLVAEDATYVSLNYDNPISKRSCRGPAPAKVPRHSLTRLRASVSSGRFWLSLPKNCSALVKTSPSLAIHLQIEDAGKNRRISLLDSFRVHDGKIVYFQFMEDTFATAASFKSGGSSIFHSDPNGKEIEI